MDEILSKLNDWLYNQTVPEYIRYDYSTNGTDEKIEILGVVVWDNLSVETYDENDNELPVEVVVKRETMQLLEEMRRISFEEFPA